MMQDPTTLTKPLEGKATEAREQGCVNFLEDQPGLQKLPVGTLRYCDPCLESSDGHDVSRQLGHAERLCASSTKCRDLVGLLGRQRGFTLHSLHIECMLVSYIKPSIMHITSIDCPTNLQWASIHLTVVYNQTRISLGLGFAFRTSMMPQVALRTSAQLPMLP